MSNYMEELITVNREIAKLKKKAEVLENLFIQEAEQKPKGLREKVEKLKYEVLEGRGYEPIDSDNSDAFESEEWTADDLRNYFYGSGDPMVEEECYVRNLSTYVFRAVDLLTDIVADLAEKVGDEK